MKIKWLAEPEAHDYPAAKSCLSLCMPDEDAHEAMVNLVVAPMTAFKAKDILRMSREQLLTVDNQHVAKNANKIHAGKALSPILLVRSANRLIIADGYHRVCAVYNLGEDEYIPCKII